MNDALRVEQRLIETTDDAELTQVDLTAVLGRLHAWLFDLTEALGAHRIQPPGAFRQLHVLAHQHRIVSALLLTSAETWEQQWKTLEPAQLLAEAFEDRVMLLVFGKFNAGKSSLCNFLAERFAALGRAARYFRMDHGRIVDMPRRFAEGPTETTASLQGVCLGSSLVLLDTPGMHSVSPENAALTQRFTDSADGVLWLTSSTSPGQVQELDALARELHRHKPLLPVITRSDFIEEDEADGEIVKRLRNKVPDNRALQEADVQVRALEQLAKMGVEAALLKPPVSVSAHVAREDGQTEQALRGSGFGQLYAALLGIVEPARAYKRRKPAEVLLHHLEENVLGAIEARFGPELCRMNDLIVQERDRLQATRSRMLSRVWRQVASEIPRLLEQYAPSGEFRRLCTELAGNLHRTLLYEIGQQLGDYDLPLAESGNACDICSGEDFSLWTTGANASEERVHGELLETVRQQMLRQIDKIFERCRQALDELVSWCETLQDLLAQQDARLVRIKHDVRSAAG